MIEKETKRQMLGFALSGLLSTVIMYVAYLIFFHFTNYHYAYFLSYFISVIALYFMNLRVFKRYIGLQSSIKFPLVYAFQYLIGAMVLEVLVKAGISELIAPILVIILLFPFTFILNKLVFKR